MKYYNETIISLPVGLVAQLFENQDNNRHWQPSLIGMRADVADPNKSLNFFEVNGRTVEVHVEVVLNNLPEYFELSVKMKDVSQKIVNRFIALDNDDTCWKIETEYSSRNYFLKLLLLIMPNLFKKNTLKYMNCFKQFAEDSNNQA